MAKRSMLGLFREPEAVATAIETLRRAGFSDRDFDVLTGSPYPEGAFGEHTPGHKLFVFPLIGAMCGFSVGLLLTAGTQLSWPLITGGKPILSIPPMMIVMYEGTMLGAIIFTVLGVIFESRLPRLGLGVYDPHITEGYIGLAISCEEERLGSAEGALREAGVEDVKHEPPRR